MLHLRAIVGVVTLGALLVAGCSPNPNAGKATGVSGTGTSVTGDGGISSGTGGTGAGPTGTSGDEEASNPAPTNRTRTTAPAGPKSRTRLRARPE